jgi:hypothetical protein
MAECEDMEMFPFRRGQHHPGRDALDHVSGRRAAAALFEPGVPGRTDIGALRHLFPA